MRLIHIIKEIFKLKKSKFDHIEIYDNGAFGLKDGYLFKDKQSTLEYIEKLNQALKNRTNQTEK